MNQNFEERKAQTVEKLTSHSQNDWQKEYNYLLTEYQEYTSKVDEAVAALKESTIFYDKLIEKYKSKRDYIVDEMLDLVKNAKKEGFAVKEKKLKYY